MWSSDCADLRSAWEKAYLRARVESTSAASGRCGTLSGVDIAYPGVCCGYRTMSEPPGSHEICVVCRWEDDVYQLR
jgi:hypothetical protein